MLIISCHVPTGSFSCWSCWAHQLEISNQEIKINTIWLILINTIVNSNLDVPVISLLKHEDLKKPRGWDRQIGLFGDWVEHWTSKYYWIWWFQSFALRIMLQTWSAAGKKNGDVNRELCEKETSEGWRIWIILSQPLMKRCFCQEIHMWVFPKIMVPKMDGL